MSYPGEPETPPLTLRIERAMRLAAVAHAGQFRKLAKPSGSSEGNASAARPDTPVPYFQHPAIVGLLLGRLGFGEDVIIAGILHDVVEDTEVTIETIRGDFGEDVADWVARCSERKQDPETGDPHPWEVRKAEHLQHLQDAPVEVRAVVLADKYHNLLSMVDDQERGIDLWSRFNAPRERVLWYYETMIEQLGGGDFRLERLANEGRLLLERVAAGSG